MIFSLNLTRTTNENHWHPDYTVYLTIMMNKGCMKKEGINALGKFKRRRI